MVFDVIILGKEFLPVHVVLDSASATCLSRNGNLSLTSLTSSLSSSSSFLTSVSKIRGDLFTPSNDSFRVIGADIGVRFELITLLPSSLSQLPSKSSFSFSTFSLLHLLTLCRINFVMSRNGKLVLHSPQTRRSFSCSTEMKRRWKIQLWRQICK